MTMIFSERARADNSLRVVSEFLPPFQVFNDAGQFSGRAVDMMEVILKEANMEESEIDVMPWARAYKTATKEKNVAIFSIAYSEKRKNLFHWIGPLYALERSSLIGLNHREDLAITSLEDAKRFRVCSELETYSYQQLQTLGFEQNKNLFSLNSLLNTFRTPDGSVARPALRISLLRNGKCDFVLGPWSTYAFDDSIGKDLKSFLYLGDPESPLVLNLAINPKSDPSVISALENAYNRLRKSGKLYDVCTQDDPKKLHVASCEAAAP